MANAWITFLKMWKAQLKYNYKYGTKPSTIYRALQNRGTLRGLLAGTHDSNGKALRRGI